MAVLRLPHVDADAVRDAVRELSRDIDVSRLSVIRDELAHLDLPSAADLRRELDRFEVELPDVGRLLHRPAKRAPWLQAPSTAVGLGLVALVTGAVVGGLLAWLYQPDRGPQRRKALRRRLRKLQRKIQHSR